MPKPVYMVCAYGASQDSESDLFSVFEIIDKVQLAAIPLPEAGQVIVLQWKPWRVFATWMRDEADPWGQEYEFDFRLCMPPDGAPTAVGEGRFRFDQPQPRPFHRLSIRFDSPIPLMGAGLLRFESRVRRVGAPEWLIQEYPVIVEPAAAEPALHRAPELPPPAANV